MVQLSDQQRALLAAAGMPADSDEDEPAEVAEVVADAVGETAEAVADAVAEAVVDAAPEPAPEPDPIDQAAATAVVIEAEAEASERRIEAEADADIRRMEAAAAIEQAHDGDADNDGIPDELDADVDPEPSHPFFRPIKLLGGR